ncbi:MAG: hypothetical protein Q8N47_04255 [Bryobacterales bacterium]|nr:hypothetical protein [Bryobacterales bacterium]
MPATTQLHQLLDQVPDSDLPTVQRIIAALAGDPALYSLLTAPYDDEPETEDERRAVQEAAACIERGQGITTEQLNRELGL